MKVKGKFLVLTKTNYVIFFNFLCVCRIDIDVKNEGYLLRKKNLSLDYLNWPVNSSANRKPDRS